MGCHIENFGFHRFSLSASSRTLPNFVMFSATDVAQMLSDSDSDDGEMEAGSDVEINDLVSSFSVKMIPSFVSLKVGCQ